MSRIEIKDYIKNVELNRQKLVNAANISSDSSLNNAVDTIVNKISSSDIPANKYEIRFFDADGQLAKTEYVEDGGTATPPIVDYDPDYLTFDSWYSFIGSNMTNLHSDVDYGASYNLKNNCTIIAFIDLNYINSVDFTLALYSGANSGSFVIDWGDGSDAETINISSKNFICNHTYATIDKYIIKISNHYNNSSNKQICIDALNSTTNMRKCFTKIYANYVCQMTISYMPNLKACIALNRINISGVMNSFRDTNGWIHYFMFKNDQAYGCNGSSQQVLIDPYIISNTESFYATYCYSLFCKKLLVPPYINFSPSNSSTDGRITCDTAYISINRDRLSTIYSFQCNKLIFIETTPTYSKQYFIALNTSGYPYIGSVEFKINSNFTLPANFLSGAHIKELTIPSNCAFENSNTLQNITGVEILNIPDGFNYSLNIKNMELNYNCLLDILNKLAYTTSNVLIISSKTNEFLSYTRVKDVLGIYQYLDDPTSITMIEAFTNKGWTVSVS